LEIKRTDQRSGFNVIRQRWFIERSFLAKLQPPFYGTLRIHRHDRRGFTKLAMKSVIIERFTDLIPTPAT
jgi:hypothetical protein